MSTMTARTVPGGMVPTPVTLNVVVLLGPRTPAVVPTPVLVLSPRTSPGGATKSPPSPAVWASAADPDGTPAHAIANTAAAAMARILINLRSPVFRPREATDDI